MVYASTRLGWDRELAIVALPALGKGGGDEDLMTAEANG